MTTFLTGVLLPTISRSSTGSFILLIYTDFIQPISLFFAALPIAIRVITNGNKHRWNDTIEDIQINMEKSIATYINSDGLEIAGARPFELRPVRTESQVNRME
jgi:hypothetical protein